MPTLSASLLSNIVNLKLNLLDQSGLNFATFCSIDLCFLMGIVSCNPVVCVTLKESAVTGCSVLKQFVCFLALPGLRSHLSFYAGLELLLQSERDCGSFTVVQTRKEIWSLEINVYGGEIYF